MSIDHVLETLSASTIFAQIPDFLHVSSHLYAVINTAPPKEEDFFSQGHGSLRPLFAHRITKSAMATTGIPAWLWGVTVLAPALFVVLVAALQYHRYYLPIHKIREKIRQRGYREYNGIELLECSCQSVTLPPAVRHRLATAKVRMMTEHQGKFRPQAP